MEQDLDKQDSFEEDTFVFPVSPAQKRLWLFDQLAPGSSPYQNLIGLSLTGRLHADRLQASLEIIIDRHESLRTTFEHEDGHPVQVVHASAQLDFQLIDLEALPEEDREAQGMRLLQEEMYRPFDLRVLPLVRTRLVRLEEQRHLLLLNLHPIISDGWSVDVLLEELTILYNASDDERNWALPPLAVQYADYTIWQEQWLQGDVLEEQLTYWKKQLAGGPDVLQLATDHPRTEQPTYRWAHEAKRMPLDLANGVRQLSQQQGTTPFMTLLAAFHTLIYRCTGQTIIRVGTPVTGRNRSELEPMIGLFANTLVIQNRLDARMAFTELLHSVREAALSAYTYQDLPFEKIVEELAPQHNIDHSPLFQLMFALREEKQLELKWSDLDVRMIYLEDEAAKCDLTLQIDQNGDQLTSVIQYNADLFEAASIRRMLKQFHDLLGGIVSDPEQPLDQLPFLTEAERNRLLHDWNDTATDYPRTSTIHELFEEQAEQTPERVALTFGGQDLSYQGLNERANQLARHLTARGVKDGMPVGLLVERSFEMVVGILGILKAGGAYVPLDPNAPAERLSFILQDLQIEVLLGLDHVLARYPSLAPSVLRLDADWAKVAVESTANPPVQGTPDHLAYVCFTSGSTGQPKGVCVPHRGVVRLVRETNYGTITPQDVFLQMSPLAFDASTFEIWGSLLNGAKLAIMEPSTPSLRELGNALADHRVTISFITTSLFHQIMETHPESLRFMQQLFVGGEFMTHSLGMRALQALPTCQIVNIYGPTENTSFTTYYPLSQADSSRKQIPIGKAISNTRLYVLDSDRQLCPVGVPGELYLGGDGVAAGYANRPGLNAEKFLPSPFRTGERLYRTGDQVRWLPDGNLEFIGRFDNQVKIRGFRIELDEIESVLSLHPNVRKAVVVVREDQPGDKRLVAYAQIEGGEGQSELDLQLRRYLQEKLPDYMVPSVIVRMDELPISPNGKVDRKALPAPDSSRQTSNAPFVAPRTETERMILAIWQEILGIETIGIHDNFFDLGGHSLLIIKLHMRLEEQFRVEIPVVEMFRHPTIDAWVQFLQPKNEAVQEETVAQPDHQRVDKRRDAILRRKGLNK